MKDKRVLIIGLLVAVLLVAIPLTVYIANQQQDVRSSAATDQTNNTITITPTDPPTATPTNQPTSTPTVVPTVATPTTTPAATGSACETPAEVTSVELNHPSCQGTSCSFIQADCTWAGVNGATSYSVKITQVDTGTVTKTDTVTAPTVMYAFPVEQGKTYRCDISAINSCGTSGPTGSAQAYCAVEGQVSSPTVATTAAPTTAQVIPTVVPTGDTTTTVLVGIGGVIVAIIGGALFFFSGI